MDAKQGNESINYADEFGDLMAALPVEASAYPSPPVLSSDTPPDELWREDLDGVADGDATADDDDGEIPADHYDGTAAAVSVSGVGIDAGKADTATAAIASVANEEREQPGVKDEPAPSARPTLENMPPQDLAAPKLAQAATPLARTAAADVALLIAATRSPDRSEHWKAFDRLTAGMSDGRRKEMERFIADAGLLPSDPSVVAAVILWRQDFALGDFVEKFERQGAEFIQMIPDVLREQVSDVLETYDEVPSRIETAMGAFRQIAAAVEADAKESLERAGKAMAKDFEAMTDEATGLVARRMDEAVKSYGLELDKGKSLATRELTLSTMELKTDIRKEVSRAAAEIAAANKVRSPWTLSTISFIAGACLFCSFMGLFAGAYLGEMKALAVERQMKPNR